MTETPNADNCNGNIVKLRSDNQFFVVSLKRMGNVRYTPYIDENDPNNNLSAGDVLRNLKSVLREDA